MADYALNDAAEDFHTSQPVRTKIKRCDKTTDYQNLLNRKFNVNAPNKVWVSDITYIRVANSFNYVCTIMDLYSRKIIAWQAQSNPDSLLVIQTLEEAWLKRAGLKL